MLSGALSVRPQPRDEFEAGLFEQLDRLREELNWLYSQINRLPGSETPLRPDQMAALHAAAHEREAAVLELARQVQHRGDGSLARVGPLDLAQLQRDLGADTAMVEYFSLDGELLAFVVTNQSVEVIRSLAREKQVEEALWQLRFQVEALRYGAAQMRNHLDELARRTRHHLGVLYDLLLAPLEERLGARRLVVVPHRALHYVPFHALHGGPDGGYVIERREVCYAPSAGILRHCLTAPERPMKHALLLGVADARTPQVRAEIRDLAPLFREAVSLLDEQATLTALHEQAPSAEVLHLACHGQFRPDSPLFSSLRLADGWLTVRDTYDLDLTRCGLVALSACETGMSAVAPGDELLGLARGFFSAGAPSLLVSLWTVDDASAATLMATFYARLASGERPAAALRHAQRELLARCAHPYFWAPFMLVGRW
jgi:CHAT domain-containing protein